MPISTLRPTHVGHFALILPLFVTLLALGWDSASVHAATNQPDQVHEGTAVREAFGMEYSVPNGPRNLVAEGPGRIWYSATDADGIGVLEVITIQKASRIQPVQMCAIAPSSMGWPKIVRSMISFMPTMLSGLRCAA